MAIDERAAPTGPAERAESTKPAAHPEPTKPTEPTLEEIAVRLDESGAQIEVQPEEARDVLQRHLAALDDLHAGALRSIIRKLRADDRGRELLFELVDEPIVRMALSVHGLIRTPPAEGVVTTAAPATAATTAATHAPTAAAPADDAPIKLAGTDPNQPLRLEITQVDGGGGVGLVARETGAVGQLDLTSGRALDTAPDLEHGGPPSMSEDGWIETFPVARIGPGRVEAVSLQTSEGEEVEAVIVNAGERLSAFVNACPHRGMPLDNALISDMEGTLTCPWHGLCFDIASAECLSLPDTRLTPLPLRVQGDHIWIRAGYPSKM